jgi:hypothetical protein
MSDDDMPRAPMRPVEWVADCPACDRASHIDDSEWEQSSSGAFHATGPGMFPVCEYCKIQFRIVPVQIVLVERKP